MNLKLCGNEKEIESALAKRRHASKPPALKRIKSAAAIALHMHQPLIPAGTSDLRTAPVISNLELMLNSNESGDRYNAAIFADCYGRIGRIIPELIEEGLSPRVMLDYSGTLLHYLEKRRNILADLLLLNANNEYQEAVEWLGSAWGHPVAPSTRPEDYKLHVRAWQQHFASLFGIEALTKVRGFSPAEMALPNHPDQAYNFVKTLIDCGYEWVLVQEHTIETAEGKAPAMPHLPHLLVCKDSVGESASIIAFIKTQGSDTKLVGQMQPWYEARGLPLQKLKSLEVPPLVTQIADGENGGVMMNEFPNKFREVVKIASGTETPLLNCSEYLGGLLALGASEKDFPVIQPIHQKLIWDRVPEGAGPEKLEAAIQELKRGGGRFHMEGGSWTSHISWVKEYGTMMEELYRVSKLFEEKTSQKKLEACHSEALFYLLCSQTSCFRYWGQGCWTDYGLELCRRTEEALRSI